MYIAYIFFFTVPILTNTVPILQVKNNIISLIIYCSYIHIQIKTTYRPCQQHLESNAHNFPNAM